VTWLCEYHGMRHYTPDERSRFVSDWRSSGMTRKAFSKQHGISSASLSLWRKRIDAATSPAKFHPLVVAQPERAQQELAEPVAEVIVGALTVRVYAGISESTLSALLKTLRPEVTC
jgi:transposase-like protein